MGKDIFKHFSFLKSLLFFVVFFGCLFFGSEIFAANPKCSTSSTNTGTCTIALECSDSQSGCESIYYCIGSNCRTSNTTVNLTIAETTSITYYSKDNAGNQESSTPLTITICTPSWTPLVSTRCNGRSFTQTNQCNSDTQTAIGTGTCYTCTRCSNNNACQKGTFKTFSTNCSTANPAPDETISYVNDNSCTALCAAGQVCRSGSCVAGCIPETDSAFCTRLGRDCGSVTANDNCGISRTVSSCGTCTLPDTCGGGGTANVCDFIDSISPVVNSFTVNTSTFNWTVSDGGGSHLNRTEVWCAPSSAQCSETQQSGCVWSQVGNNHYAPAGSDYWSSSATQSLAGCSYICGLHVIDNVGNMGEESSVKKLELCVPSASFSCHPNGCSSPAGACTGYTQSNFCLKNNSTDSGGSGNIQGSNWSISGQTSDSSQCFGICNWTLPSHFSAGNYSSLLTITNKSSISDSESKSFTILQEAIAAFDCSLAVNGPWQSCDTLRIVQGSTVYFRDLSSASIGGQTITNWSWKFKDGVPGTSNIKYPSAQFKKSKADSGEVELTIIDSAGRTDSATHHLLINLFLPEWQEIAPF